MASPFEKVYIGVGSNLGDRSSYLEQAKSLTAQIPQSHFLRSSTIYETDPVGGHPQRKYLNAVWEIETALPPQKLKNELKKIEKALGREPASRNAPRQIDLDIIFYGDQIMEQEDLKIPHPRLHERAFVLQPLSELAPHMIHPQSKKTVRELLKQLES